MSGSSSSRGSRMLVRFESKSNRVKGLAFHPRRPWILASLHNGAIHLYDYLMGVCIDKYEEHEGPVRGIHFHPAGQPLFVSGGDDYRIKVWNYQQKRCLFTLYGHLDYIRSVQFHPEYPWILSASDDQTIRIWNWQNRQPLSVLMGHNHYVMCAQFHPKEDLILSASLDQTVRVWDFSGLRKKYVSNAGDFSPAAIAARQASQAADQAGSGDLFGASDVIVKHVLEGHTRGVNWASFHRTLSLIVSGADDREVKLWRMNESKAWEVDTMRGHINNVSCVLFHPKKELIISNSEDKTIRVWDISKVSPTQVLRRDDRYWILDAHPTLNLLAAGHDSGLVVFKLNRERPPFDSSDLKNLYYFKDSYVYEYNYKSGKEQPILSTRRRGSNLISYRSLQYNSANRSEHCILLNSDSDGSYELYVMRKERDGRAATGGIGIQVNEDSIMRGFAKCAVFVSRNRFAVLDKSRQLFLKTLRNETKRKLTIPNVSVSYIFPGGVGRLLLRTSEAMLLYDIQSLKVIAELPTTQRAQIKYVVWSGNTQYLAMFSKSAIYITDNRLQELCSHTETTRVKSGAWDPIGVFVYSTSTHLKYLLPNGESGILRTLEQPIYLTQVSGPQVHYVDREGRASKLTIEATEYLFKIALMKRRNREVLKIMQSKKLVGDSIIAYLHKKGFPEVALHFVEDLSIKFDLALECGNIPIALECAEQLNSNACWQKLGVEALRQGNHQVVEKAYVKTGNFERLSFLYLISGNSVNLGKMLQIATMRGDLQSRFHNSLLLGNVQERIQVLREAGQLQLAYLTARTHGLEDLMAALAEELGEKVPDEATIPDTSDAKLLSPPIPLSSGANWPLNEVRKGFFEQLDAPEVDDGTADSAAQEAARAAEYEDSGDERDPTDLRERERDALEWGDASENDPLGLQEEKERKAARAEAIASDLADVGAGWGGDLDLDIELPAGEGSDELDSLTSDKRAGGDVFVMPLHGKSAAQKWSDHCSLPCELIAAGNFDLAMHMLNRQAGIVNFEPLKDHFLTIFNAASLLMPVAPGISPLQVALRRSRDGEEKGDDEKPEIALRLDQFTEALKAALKSVTEGKFQQALKEFQSILHAMPFVVVERKARLPEVQELINTCREYLTAMRLELTRKDTADLGGQALLAALFTHTKLQSTHLVLGLRTAIKCAYQINNFGMTANFCRRLLELMVSSGNSGAALEKLINPTQIKGILAACEKKNNVDEKPVEYASNSPFQFCSRSFKILAKSKPPIKCAFCQANYDQQFEDGLCDVCGIGKIGAEATGLKNIAE